MLKIISLIALVLLSGCAGINFCKENEQPKKTGCHAWDPATRTGAGGRS